MADGHNAISRAFEGDEDRLTQSILALASKYGRLWISQDHRAAEDGRVAGGQGSSAAHLAAGRVEGSRPKQRPRGRLWLNDGSCIRLRPQHRNHVWSYDFVERRRMMAAACECW